MATMVINVIKENLPLITNVNEQSNECKTVVTFTTKGYEGEHIEVEYFGNKGEEPHRKVERYVNSQWEEIGLGYPFAAVDRFVVPESQQRRYRIHIYNAKVGREYNGTKITARNISTGLSETREFTRSKAGGNCEETRTLNSQQYIWTSTEQLACEAWFTQPTNTYYTTNSDYYNPGEIYTDIEGINLAPGGIYAIGGGMYLEWTGSQVINHGTC